MYGFTTKPYRSLPDDTFPLTTFPDDDWMTNPPPLAVATFSFSVLSLERMIENPAAGLPTLSWR